jgi:hypothetical protein
VLGRTLLQGNLFQGNLFQGNLFQGKGEAPSAFCRWWGFDFSAIW